MHGFNFLKFCSLAKAVMFHTEYRQGHENKITKMLAYTTHSLATISTKKEKAKKLEAVSLAGLTTLSFVSGMFTHFVSSSTPVVCQTQPGSWI